ncbi:MAG: hypothetical protein JNK05_36195 [Myxococcales bacterium]|nr:hypothetical protein [Myxococcales bacterium]
MARDKDDRDVLAKTAARDDAHGLDANERKVLDEALARGETVRKTVEDAVAEYGRWLFVQLFGGDTALVLERRDEHPLWIALLLASDGPRLRISPETLERALLSAVYDKRLNSDAWRSLDYGRKSRLVRLEDEKLLRKAAQHVLATNLRSKQVEAYVRELLRAQGEPVQSRLTLGRIGAKLERFTGEFAESDFVTRATQVYAAADEAERSAMLDHVDSAQKALATLRAKLVSKSSAKPARKKARRAKPRRR